MKKTITKTTKKTDKAKQKEKLKARAKVQKSENEPMRSQTTQSQNILNFADLLTQAIEMSVQKSTKEQVKSSEKEIEKLKEKLNVAITRYRTKFMEHSHAKIQWNKQKTKMVNVIEELKSELVKYSPDNKIFDTVENILAITNENHVARKKSKKISE